MRPVLRGKCPHWTAWAKAHVGLLFSILVLAGYADPAISCRGVPPLPLTAPALQAQIPSLILRRQPAQRVSSMVFDLCPAETKPIPNE